MILVALLPQLFLALGGIAVYCLGAFLPRRSGLPFWLALFCTGGGLLAAIFGNPATANFAGLIDVTLLGRLYTGLICLLTLLVVLLLHFYAKLRGFAGEVLYGTLLFAALGLVVLASASHWLVFFLGFELLSIALYILIAIRKDKELSYEAAIKYFITGAVASSFLVFGIALLYGGTGTLAIRDSMAVIDGSSDSTLAWGGIGLILVGVGFKLSLVPFHIWTPDVYEGAPAPVTAFLATSTKIAIFAFLLHLFRGMPLTPPLQPLFWGLAALTMLVGNLTALVQSRVKRLLAYSSMAQMGYLLIPLLAGGPEASLAILFYSAVYGLMDLAAFGALGLLSAREEDLDHLDDFRGLGYRQPLAAGLLALGLLALAGLPPTGGLLGKLLIFTAAIRGGYPVLALLGISVALVSVFYYFRVVVILYLQKEGMAAENPGTGPAGKLAAVVIILGLLWLGLLPQGIMVLLGRAAAVLG